MFIKTITTETKFNTKHDDEVNAALAKHPNQIQSVEHQVTRQVHNTKNGWIDHSSEITTIITFSGKP